ncbi:hypothetical protein GC176_19200 [bacterium]|nr:hypothetical protein [bacterium]
MTAKHGWQRVALLGTRSNLDDQQATDTLSAASDVRALRPEPPKLERPIGPESQTAQRDLIALELSGRVFTFAPSGVFRKPARPAQSVPGAAIVDHLPDR